ncbi:type II toxin-antitoxin system Phd/YefM family antitoxin [Blastomonas sp.]|uniref:type II toxin-antitoxin system Phd/YefM family antitoxin n=1 Tax=Blastomonas sp. TaxID=1909299 RepID=UPI00391CBE39
MEMSIREAQARFSEVMAAVMRGERVVIMQDGRAVAEMKSLVQRRKGGVNWEAGEALRKRRGLDKIEGQNLWPPEFDDPAFSRRVLGLED